MEKIIDGSELDILHDELDEWKESLDSDLQGRLAIPMMHMYEGRCWNLLEWMREELVAAKQRA